MAGRVDRLFNLPQAIINVSNQCIEAGFSSGDVIAKVAMAWSKLLSEHLEAEQAAALLRIEAAKIEATAPLAGRRPCEQELIELIHRSHEFINTLQVAGFEERTIVASVTNACIERTARTAGAPGASNWLRKLAKIVDANTAAIETTARGH